MAINKDDESEICDEWWEYFDSGKLADLNRLIDEGLFTIAQLAALSVITLKESDPNATLPGYLLLIHHEIAKGRLDPKHPATLIRYSDMLDMVPAGLYGQRAEQLPVPGPDWLLPLKEVEAWFASKARPIDLSTLKADLHSSGKSARAQGLIPEVVAPNRVSTIGRAPRVYWRTFLAERFSEFEAQSAGKASARDAIRWLRKNGGNRVPDEGPPGELVWVDEMGTRQIASLKTVGNALSELRLKPKRSR
jgi:hypothetical protein